MKILQLKDFLRFTLVVLVVLRIVIIAMNIDMASFGGRYFLFRHTVYTFAWATLLWFLSELSLEGTDTIDKVKVIKMKNASFWAMIACMAKFLVTLYYQLPFEFPSYFTLAYTIVELLAWLLFSVFFFCFWRWKKKQESNVQ